MSNEAKILWAGLAGMIAGFVNGLIAGMELIK